MKRLIVNADDFGFSPNRNRGIIESVEKGIVTSVSILVNFPAAEEAIDFVKGRDLGGRAASQSQRRPAGDAGAQDAHQRRGRISRQA